VAQGQENTSIFLAGFFNNF